jgi:hypothetical protein
MTYEQYLQQANVYFVFNQEHLRYGQALANHLSRFSPIAYVAVCAADKDPFYVDALVPEFLDFLSSNWATITQPARA